MNIKTERNIYVSESRWKEAKEIFDKGIKEKKVKIYVQKEK